MDSTKFGSLGRDTRASRAIIFLLSLGFAALLIAAVAVFWNEASAALVTRTLAVEAPLGLFASATGLLILIVAAATLFLVRRNLAELRESRTELRWLNDSLEQLVDARTAEFQRATMALPLKPTDRPAA